MNVSLIKIDRKRNKYHLTLKPDVDSKREKKVARAIALTLCKSHPYIGSGPASLGANAEIYLNVIPIPSISEREFRAALESHTEPPWNSAYEVQQGIVLDRKVDANIEYHKTLRSEAIAKQYGLHKLIPKAIKAKFTCRCGVAFKKKYKLHRHQEFCTVLAEERGNFANIAAILAIKKVKDVSKSPEEKKKQRSSRQRVSDKSNSKKQKRKKASKPSR